MKTITITVLLALFLQGCAPALLIGAIGYATSAGRQSRAGMLGAYSDYKIKMGILNTEREEKDMAPLDIDTYEEWYQRSK